ncbi:MAG: chemotaxis protein CheW, partial [Poseidonibacter sp.]|uniref:chemotaxis protein CheW n=1 Tax=Poseidonibacter sp. TaxID=2321188 RepID=UPI00359E261E
MPQTLLNYKGINVKKELYPIIKHIEDVDKYREELGRLSSSWDILALLGQLGDINIDIGKTKENFLNLTSTLLNHLSEETVKKVSAEMKFKSQVVIDVLIRNLFERTADIGFLATDDDIRFFINNYVSKYNDDSNKLKDAMKHRFNEYVKKYSVYFDIVLTDTKGRILVRLNDEFDMEKIDHNYLQKVLNTNEDYVEDYDYHDFLPQFKKSLVYSYKVTKENDSTSESLGTLSLCFRFRDEMQGIFDNLVDSKNKEALTILDKDGYVIASSDKEHIPLNAKLQIVLNDTYKIVSFQGRDYLAKTSKTNGYQGFNGLELYGHIMIPLEYAFLSNELNTYDVKDEIIEAMMRNEQHFSSDLKEVFSKSNTIQENLARVIWNGNISQSKQNSSNRDFSKSLLNEIGITGTKANASLINLNQTIISSILKDSEFLSSLAIDIMDRNLYERANDCRWWALNSYFREALDDYSSINFKKEKISSILEYINDLYTVYPNLILFDKEGRIIAVSNKKDEYLVDKVLTQEWVSSTLSLKNTSKYAVSKFEKTYLYDNKSTYIYTSAIRSLKNENIINGGIAIVFDSEPEFNAMLEDTLPKDENSNNKEGTFALFTNKNKEIISSTNENLQINNILNIDDKFFELKNNESFSEIIEFENKYYAVGVRASNGYREYKSNLDDYKNDVFCFVFICIGDVIGEYTSTLNKKEFSSTSKKKFTEESVELATFYLGNKFLAVNAKNVIKSIAIDKLELSIDMNKNNPFKGMVLHKENLISVLDIRQFVNEEITDEELSNIV